MRIGICDDDKFIFPKIEEELRRAMDEAGLELSFYAFDSGNGLLRFLQDGELDLLFLDIDMPGKNGIELAMEIGQSHPDCEIAFCTNYLEFATEVYETRHCYYVLKEEFAKRLPDVLRKVRRRQEQEAGRLCLRHRGGNELIRIRDILYLERRGKKTYLYLEGGECKETALKLGELLEELKDSGFVRCHNSYAVSLEKVIQYSRQRLWLKGGFQISISRPYIEGVKREFARWNWKKM